MDFAKSVGLRLKKKLKWREVMINCPSCLREVSNKDIINRVYCKNCFSQIKYLARELAKHVVMMK